MRTTLLKIRKTCRLRVYLNLLILGIICCCIVSTNKVLSANPKETSVLYTSGDLESDHYDQQHSIDALNPTNAEITSFHENKGQFPEDIYYYAYISNGMVAFGESQVFFTIEDQKFNVTFSGSNMIIPRGEGFQESCSNYFYGSKSFIQVRSCQRIIYEELYHGISLVYKLTPQGLKYDYIIEPYTQIDQIQMTYSGLDKVTVEPTTIRLAVSNVTLYDDKLQAYYEATKQPIAICFSSNSVLDNQEEAKTSSITNIHFTIKESYDQTQRIIIDPLICDYSTYIGGSGDDHNDNIDICNCHGYNVVMTDQPRSGVAIDSAGNIIITGGTHSIDWPSSQAYQENYNGGNFDVFITKFISDGQKLLFSTFLGGSDADGGLCVTLDSSNNIVVVGYTGSNDFPTTANAYQSNYSGGSYYSSDVFIVKISADGQKLLYSSFLGGSEDEWGYGVAIDANDNIVVTGSTSSDDFPNINAYQNTTISTSGSYAVFVTKLSSDGQSLEFSTYMSGSGIGNWGYGVAIDSSDNIVITGGTNSQDFPTTENSFQSNFGGSRYDAIVVKFNATGSLLFSTYLGGNGFDWGNALTIDSSDDIVVTGYVGLGSSDFPISANAYQTNHSSGESDVFITKLSSDGQFLLYSSYLGGYNNDEGYGIALDAADNIVISGKTKSSDFPTYQGSYCNDWDAFVVELSADGQLLLSSTYIGGNNSDQGHGVAITTNGNIIVMGYTNSIDFPTVNAYQENNSANYDIFICKFLHSKSISTETTSTETSSQEETVDNDLSSSGFDFPFVVLELVIIGIFVILKNKRKEMR
jgi:hypothetical protein